MVNVLTFPGPFAATLTSQLAGQGVISGSRVETVVWFSGCHVSRIHLAVKSETK